MLNLSSLLLLACSDCLPPTLEPPKGTPEMTSPSAGRMAKAGATAVEATAVEAMNAGAMNAGAMNAGKHCAGAHPRCESSPEVLWSAVPVGLSGHADLNTDGGRTAKAVAGTVAKTAADTETSQDADILQKGDSGQAVRQLQLQLQNRDLYNGEIDGEFGVKTQTAVVTFQREQGLTANGIVAADTWARLRSPQSNSKPPTQISPDATTAASPRSSSKAGSPAKSESTANPKLAVNPQHTIRPWHSATGNLGGLESGPRSLLLLLGGGAAVLVTGRVLRWWQQSRRWDTAVDEPDGEESVGERRQPAKNRMAGLGQLASGQLAPEKRAFGKLAPGDLGPWATDEFSDLDEQLVLKQSPAWSKLILWSIVGLTSVLVVWANVAKIDEAIPVQGKLEPQGEVKAVQAPMGGVVKTVHVQEGQRVKKGDLLVSFDDTTAQARLKSLLEIRQQLAQENAVYQPQAGGAIASPELAQLTQNRTTLLQENQLYQAELGGTTAPLSADMQARLQSRQMGRDSRVAAAQLSVAQLGQQLSQVQTQLAAAKANLSTTVEITANLENLVAEGAFARLPYLERQQTANTGRAEVERLIQEEGRIRLAIAQAEEQVQTTIAQGQDDAFGRIAANNQRLAEIDSQLTKAVLENQKRLQEIDGQITEAKLALNYQELRAPSDGTVFDLKPPTASQYVANATEPILKIVPDDRLVAKVSVDNQHIGFITEGMVADVRIDSFPFSEFGDIQGQLAWISSDALPPEQAPQAQSQAQGMAQFPAKISLRSQTLRVNGRDVKLRSGMSLSANIKIRQRTVMSVFTEQFANSAESLTFMR
jgi:hemolysin D